MNFFDTEEKKPSILTETEHQSNVGVENNLIEEQNKFESWSPENTADKTEKKSQCVPISENAIIDAISSVYDPEIPVNIYELGLIYAIDLTDDNDIHVEMTLTAPNCPSAQELPVMVQEALEKIEGVHTVKVEIVWDPPWDISRMSDEARLALNMF